MKARIACLAIALLSVMLSGCTVVGIAMGKMADNKNAQFHRVSWADTRSVPRGRTVQVTLTSGDTLTGQFGGLRSLPPDSYRHLYDSTRAQMAADSLLPRLGDTVFFTPVKGPRIRGPFRGLEAEALVVYRKEDYSTECLPLSNVARLQGGKGESYDLTGLRALASSRALPSDREFVLQSAGQTQRIPLERIQEVYAPPQTTHNWVLGGFIGLAIDMVVVVFVAPTIKFDLAPDIDWNSSSSETGYWCW